MRFVGALTLAALPAIFAVGVAQDAPPAAWSTVTFHFERAGLAVSRYTIVLQADGHGSYWEGQPDYNAAEVPNGQLHEIQASAATRAKLAAAQPVVSTGKCETHLKKIAQTGQKTLVFAANGATQRCEFNYSDEDVVNASASTFQAIAATMEAGTRLAKLHRYDRLGLDAEMESLVNQLKEGRALEPANIAPVLQSIVDDERVIERVRRKAARILGEAIPAK